MTDEYIAGGRTYYTLKEAEETGLKVYRKKRRGTQIASFTPGWKRGRMSSPRLETRSATGEGQVNAQEASEVLERLEKLPGPEYVKAVGTDEVQEALEVAAEASLAGVTSKGELPDEPVKRVKVIGHDDSGLPPHARRTVDSVKGTVPWSRSPKSSLTGKVGKGEIIHHRQAQTTGATVTITLQDAGLWLVECLSHGEAREKSSRSDAKQAARHPEEWCPGCKKIGKGESPKITARVE